MEIKYQVFVSSTYEDLKDERKEVCQAILEMHCIPAGMELFPASNDSQWEFIKKVIDDSDFYLLIVAGKYGSTCKNEDGKDISYTEMEYDYALRQGKPIIALVYDNIDTLIKSKCESSKKKEMLLARFRNKVCEGRIIKKWSNKDNLKAATLTALAEEIKHTNCLGWVKNTYVKEIESILKQLEEEKTKRSEEEQKNMELKKNLDSAVKETHYYKGETKKLGEYLLRIASGDIDEQIEEELDALSIADIRYREGLFDILG